MEMAFLTFLWGWVGCSWGEVFSLILNKRLSFWQTMLLPWRTLDTVNSDSSSRWECALGLCVGALRAGAVLMCRICWTKLFFSSQKPVGLFCSRLSLEFFFPFAYCVCDIEAGEKHRGRPFPLLASPSFLSEEVQTLLRTWDMSLSSCFSSFTPLVSPQAIIPPPPTYLSATCLFLSHVFCGLFMLMCIWFFYFSWCLECHCSIIKPVP